VSWRLGGEKHYHTQETKKYKPWSVFDVAVHVLSEAEGKNLHLCLVDSSLTIILTPKKQIDFSSACEPLGSLSF
jgi:hypothetical protein